MLHLSLLQQFGHQTKLIFIKPLQNEILSIFLQFLHFSLSLTLIGESFIWITLFGPNYVILSIGLPQETAKVENRYWGGQCNYDCPSGLVTLMQSMVFRTKAILSMRVQYCYGLGLPGWPQLNPLMMILSLSKVNCRIEESLRSLSFENNAVLLLFINILVYLTDELDQISRLLPLPQIDSAFSSLIMLTLDNFLSDSKGQV